MTTGEQSTALIAERKDDIDGLALAAGLNAASRRMRYRHPAAKLSYQLLPFVAALAGLITCALAYYPGILEPDSLEQFAQARSGHFSDWHPPIMALLWRALNTIYVGPQPLLLLHLAMFWLALALIARALMASGVRWAALFPVIGFAPWMVPLLGVLIKDVAVVSAWLLAAALVFHRRARGRSLNGGVLTAAGLAFLYGALARWNTIIAAAPLVFYACAELAPRRSRLRLVATAVTPFALMALAGALNGSVAESEYPLGSLQVFDLGGISHFSGRNVFPGRWSAAQSDSIVRCYEADEWAIYGEPACARAVSKLDAQDLWNRAGLTPAWLGAIARHPLAYMEFRLDYSNHFFRWLRQPPGWLDYDTEDTAPPAFAHRSNAIYDFYSQLAQLDYVALRPYFWLVLGVTVFLLAALALPSAARGFAAALSASAVFYLLFYVVVGVAPDFRYALWSIAATLAAGAALFACRWPARRLRIAAIAGFALIAVAIGISMLAGAAPPDT